MKRSLCLNGLGAGTQQGQLDLEICCSVSELALISMVVLRLMPLACAAVAVRLRYGVPSRRNRRNVLSTRTVSAGG